VKVGQKLAENGKEGKPLPARSRQSARPKCLWLTLAGAVRGSQKRFFGGRGHSAPCLLAIARVAPRRTARLASVLTSMFRGTSLFTFSVSLVHLQCIVRLSAWCETSRHVEAPSSKYRQRDEYTALQCAIQRAGQSDRATHRRPRDPGKLPPASSRVPTAPRAIAILDLRRDE
jgi:hypothetical protein